MGSEVLSLRDCFVSLNVLQTHDETYRSCMERLYANCGMVERS